MSRRAEIEKRSVTLCIKNAWSVRSQRFSNMIHVHAFACVFTSAWSVRCGIFWSYVHELIARGRDHDWNQRCVFNIVVPLLYRWNLFCMTCFVRVQRVCFGPSCATMQKMLSCILVFTFFALTGIGQVSSSPDIFVNVNTRLEYM